MGDHDHGHALSGQIFHDVQHLAHDLRVQGAGGLVKEHDLRVHTQGTGDGHPLLLAAGEAAAVGMDKVAQPHFLQVLDGGFLRLLPLEFLHGHGGHGAVIQHVFVVEQIEALEYHADALAQGVEIGAQIHQVLAVKPDVAGIGILQQVDAAQQGALAGAGGADDAHHFPWHDLQVNALEDFQTAEGLLQLFNSYYRFHSQSPQLELGISLTAVSSFREMAFISREEK